MTVDMRKIKKRTINGKTVIGGITINPDKMRVEWDPKDLTENVYGVLAVIKNSFGKGFHLKGDIKKLAGRTNKFYMEYEYGD